MTTFELKPLRIKELKCKLITNKNQFDKALFPTKVDTVGKLIESYNPENGKTSWEVIFPDDNWICFDEAVLLRYVKVLK
jgi:hypothetical protein